MSMLSKLATIQPRRIISFDNKNLPADLSVVRADPQMYENENGILTLSPANKPTFAYRSGELVGLQVYGGGYNWNPQSNLSLSMPATDGITRNKWLVTLDVKGTALVTAPNGLNEGVMLEKFQHTTVSHHARLSYSSSHIDGITRTYSVYLRAGNADRGDLVVTNDYSTANSVWATFVLSGEGSIINKGSATTATEVSYGIERVANGPWYRCWITYNFNAAASYAREPGLLVYPGYRSTQSLGMSIGVWGIMHNDGSQPQPYIATAGSSATRAGDLITSTDTFKYGTILVKSRHPNPSAVRANSSLISFGDSNNYLRLFSSNTNGNSELINVAAGVAGVASSVNTPNGVLEKKIQAISISSDGVLVCDGTTVVQKAISGLRSTPLSGMNFGSWTSSGVISLNGYLNKVVLFDNVMSAEELLNLTRIHK